MEVVLRFLKILAVLLACGIVGPLFVVLYFAFGDPTASWMLYTGVGITALLVLISLGIAVVLTRKDKQRKHFEANGVLAVGDVVGVRETGVVVNDRPVMALLLDVHGAEISPFRAEVKTRVGVMQASSVAARKLVVLVLPGTEAIEIDWQRSALLAGQVSARFTSTSTGREYDLAGQSEPLLEIMRILKANDIGVGLQDGAAGVVDVRANPSVCRQIDAVLGKCEPVPAPKETRATPRGTIAERLAELEQLKAAALVSETEYNAKRAEILADL